MKREDGLKRIHATNYGSKSEPEMGKFIVFEGTDGVGKSTQLGLAYQYILRETKDSVIHTSEPSSSLSDLCTEFRRLIFSGSVDPLQQGLLFFLDHYTNAKIVRNALKYGHVLSDRWGIFSHIAYSRVKEVPEIVNHLNYRYLDSDPRPDLVIQLKYPANVIRERLEKRADKPTKQKDKPWGERLDLLEKTEEGYKEAEKWCSNWQVIEPDNLATPEDIFTLGIQPLIDETLND